MNYELAKKLKEAGFPQNLHKNIDCGGEDGCYHFLAPEPYLSGDQMAFIPTLSELIEACGDKFWTLTLGTDGTGNGKWHTRSDDTETLVHGQTPEEAVANLWLELNK